MTLKSHAKVYDTIGRQYTKRRQPDPRIAATIREALGDAVSICNVGAGSGSYEPTDKIVTAVEPSQTMIDQRTSSCTVIRASAEKLPFADNEFDAAMAIMSVHHWEDPAKGLAEMKRISRRQVVFTFDPELQDTLWLVSHYIPEIVEFAKRRALPIAAIAGCLGTDRIVNVPIPHDCTDGFQAAYWRRPEMYLEADVQATISILAQLPKDVVESAMQRLRTDIEDGTWQRRYGHLLCEDSRDFGYRIIIANNQA